MEDYTSTPKETEFNSSVATLIRVDQLIRELHCLRRGIIPRDKFGFPVKTGNTTELYLDTLFDLHIEVATKMNKGKDNELSKSEKYQEGIDDCKGRYGVNLKMSTLIKGMPSKEYRNDLFYLGWEELHKLGDEYFSFLMNAADVHGMLLINKKEMDEEPDEW